MEHLCGLKKVDLKASMKASVRKHDIYIFDGGGVIQYLTELTGKVRYLHGHNDQTY